VPPALPAEPTAPALPTGLLTFSARDLSAGIEDRSARGIAAAMSRLVRSGRLAPGARLPTVRQMAKELGVSPTTVSEAWQQLAQVGLVEALGRNGTLVRNPRSMNAGRRYARIAAPSSLRLDLSTGVPDPDLLPDLGRALGRVQRSDLTSSYLDAPVLERLEDQLRDRWPFTPEMVTVVDGAMDALDRIAGAVVSLGDRVVVEDPCFAPLLDLLDALGAEPIGVSLDRNGMVVDEFAAACERRPVAVFLQPRAHNPTGVSMTAERSADLAAILQRAGNDSIVVVEDDHAGDIATSSPVSLGAHLPGRVVHVHGFSKSHGPDLRLAAIGGSGDVIGHVVERRSLGVGWSSRLLQAVLAELLDDEVAVREVQRAREAYAERRRHFVDALAHHGVVASAHDGINCWVPVTDERAAVVQLGLQGIGAAPGGPFQLRRSGPDHIRLTIGLVAPDSIDGVAAAVATAARPATAPLRR
jgi:DNA-binding transcriptional MocR family regulator